MKAFYELRHEELFVGKMTEYPFPLHVHETVEVAIVLDGECSVQLDGRDYTLSPGDAAIAFPLIPHSYNALADGTNGFAAIFPADMVTEFSSIFHTMLPDEPVIRREQLSNEALLLARRLMETGEDQGQFLKQAYLHVILAYLVHAMRFHAAAAYNERGLGARVVRYVYDHACENISISSAAHDLGISESHLSHLFTQQFRVNFRAFINAIRIDKATMLMRDPFITLTEIYSQCGYDNIRTFRRAFVQETGMLPAAYMRLARRAGAENVPKAPDEPKNI
ncbi:MAG: helix-turn-helix transcriptional regulator [Clostridia bacterium]|nr:helix-turn-helix transcriptional regulator [Clostridia bacterium]